MIRPALPNDEATMMQIASVIGLFDSNQLILLRDMFRKTIVMTGEGIPFWLVFDHAEGVSGVVYCEQERMTNGTWNLQFIAVHPKCQKRGLGTELLKATEQVLMNQGARVLIVETAGVPDFEHVREFYLSKGFTKESTIRDFYEEGVDKVTFWKSLV